MAKSRYIFKYKHDQVPSVIKLTKTVIRCKKEQIKQDQAQ